MHPYHAMVPSWLGLECAHALGTQEASREKGPCHCVISLEMAQNVDMNVFWNHDEKTKMTNRQMINHSMPAPQSSNLEKRSVEWIAFGRTEEESDEVKFSNDSLDCTHNFKFITTSCDTLTFLCEPKSSLSDFHLGMQLFLKSHEKVTEDLF